MSPKVNEAVSRLRARIGENPRHKAVVYANYLGTLDDYGKQLEEAGVPYAAFRGDMKKKERDQNIRDFNEGKTKALLVSGAGGEGLDLKGTRQVQVLEPHWNEEKLRQVIGRARRYKSHDHLPEAERSVTVERYASRPVGLFGAKKGIEDILYDTAAQKQRLNDQVLGMLSKQSAARRQGSLIPTVETGPGSSPPVSGVIEVSTASPRSIPHPRTRSGQRRSRCTRLTVVEIITI